jgi:hypothetical protein
VFSERSGGVSLTVADICKTLKFQKHMTIIRIWQGSCKQVKQNQVNSDPCTGSEQLRLQRAFNSSHQSAHAATARDTVSQQLSCRQ